jgi:PIF1-like helicase
MSGCGKRPLVLSPYFAGAAGGGGGATAPAAPAAVSPAAASPAAAPASAGAGSSASAGGAFQYGGNGTSASLHAYAYEGRGPPKVARLSAPPAAATLSAAALNDDQRAAVEAVRTGANVCIVGKGGTGKTFLLRHICQDLEARGASFAVVAATGSAANAAGGITMHKFMTPVPMSKVFKTRDVRRPLKRTRAARPFCVRREGC